MSNKDFFLTTHAVERLYERHPKIFKNPKETDYQVRLKTAYRVLTDAIEDKSFMNCSVRRVYLHEKYGYDKTFKVFINKNVLFIGAVDGPKRVIVTVLDSKTQRF